MKQLLIAAALLVVTGCGTLTATFSRCNEEDPLTSYPSTFPALQFDTEVYTWLFDYNRAAHSGIDRAFHDDWFFWGSTFLFTTVDYPISAVTDTLCWPYDKWRTNKKASEPQPEPQQEVVEEVK